MSNLRQEAIRFFSNPIFSDSIESTTNDFPHHIDSTLRKYSKALKDIPFWEALFQVHYPSGLKEYWHLKNRIDNFSVNINKCLKNYYLGKISYAYSNLQEGLNNILFSRSKIFNEAVLSFPENELTLYRIRRRQGNDTAEFERKEMFHIPFEKRRLVSTQRYSIPGHPSLYCGDSVFVCWMELNQPAVKDIYASRFINSKEIKLIEIKSLKDLIEDIETLEGKQLSTSIVRFLLLYPLIVSCSTKVASRQEPFKPEYIIPQLFLQYIIDEKSNIDGIKYFSTRIDADRVNNVGISNFVFPAKSNSKDGYCQILINKFNLTNPLLWEYEEISKSNVSFLAGNIDEKKTIELYKGRKVPYAWTTFSGIEETLNYPLFNLKSLNDN